MEEKDRRPAGEASGGEVGGVTAHAPGIHHGADLSGVIGAAATNAEDVAASLAAGDSAGTEIPLHAFSEFPKDAPRRGADAPEGRPE